MHCFPLPQFVINKIDKLCIIFIWTGKLQDSRKSPIAWKQVCRPKSQGGQGIINLTVWNQIAMLKCLWNLCKKSDNLWVKWVHMIYIKDQDIKDVKIKYSCSWVMRKILELQPQVQKYQQEWDKMLQLDRYKMSIIYNVVCCNESKVD